MLDRKDLSNDDELLLIDCFANENGFSATLHEGDITGLAQDNDDQDNDNDENNSNTD